MKTVWLTLYTCEKETVKHTAQYCEKHNVFWSMRLFVATVIPSIRQSDVIDDEVMLIRSKLGAVPLL